MSLREWSRKGWLGSHKTSPQEISDLLWLADRDLHDCGAKGLTPDWRLTIAYNAALQSAKAALAASGYRASREAQHVRIIGSLEFTVGLELTDVQQLDMFRRKRNISDYERSGQVSEVEADEMAELAIKVREQVIEWLREKDPRLLASYESQNNS